MREPTVTILTPAYNHEAFIGACIESVLAQTYPHWEQIIIDDGSTDRTAAVVASYRDPRIRCVQLPHRGLAQLSETYNVGLAASRGDLVAVLEGDDCWPAHKLEAQVPSFADERVFLSWGWATTVDHQGRPLQPISTLLTREPRVELDASEAFARLTRRNIFAPAATVMLRRSAIDAVGGFRQTGSALYVDLPTWLCLTARTRGRAQFVNRELARYRVHQQQVTQRFRRSMDAEHEHIVRAAAAELDEDARQRLGWERLRRGAAFAGRITSGVARLREAQYADAARSFVLAFRDAHGWRDRAKAILGLVSACVHTDLLTRIYALRDARVASRLSSKAS